jgi:hypothetical protein
MVIFYICRSDFYLRRRFGDELDRLGQTEYDFYLRMGTVQSTTHRLKNSDDGQCPIIIMLQEVAQRGAL